MEELFALRDTMSSPPFLPLGEQGGIAPRAEACLSLLDRLSRDEGGMDVFPCGEGRFPVPQA